MNKLSPSSVAAKAFLHHLDAKGIFTFQTFDDCKDRKDRSLARVLHGTLEQHFAALASIQEKGGGIFVMVNEGDGVIHTGKTTCRNAENVVAVRSVFVDLDGSPLAPVLKGLYPSIVVESSPDRWHGYWLTHDCPLDDFRKRQQQIAAKFNGDPKVIDLPRVMRLPGFFHQKAEPFMTRMTFPE